MVERFYRADYTDNSGRVLASYSFQAPANVLAKVEVDRYKRTFGCDLCSICTSKVTLTGKVYPEPEAPKKRGRKPKLGINKKNY